MGFGSEFNPPNRFETQRCDRELDQLEADDEYLDRDKKRPVEYLFDDSQSIVSENNSPDLPFQFSLNPYRGCSHGCSYCYARPGHEYLGLGAGLDFETKLVVKPKAAELFRNWLTARKTAVSPVILSGVTDPYQPAEAQFQLTRQCLAVAAEMRQPMMLITKNRLIRRDIDLLGELARQRLAAVTISITSLDQSLIRVMEPRTSSPQSRLETVRLLSDAGIPVSVMTAPIIPGLNDQEIPELLRAIADAGASSAGYTVLRLPLSVEPVFIDWLERHFPDRKSKILERIRSLRDGKLNDSRFGIRMKGSGFWADQFRQLFNTFSRKYHLQRPGTELRKDLFRAIDNSGREQLKLF